MQVAGRVRRRLLAGAVVSHAGWGLVLGSAAGLVLVLATRMGWLVSAPASPEASGSVPWWGLLAACVGIGLVIGGGLGLLRRRSLLEAAQMADAVSGLRDRLSNAVSFSMRPDVSASEQLAIADGERSTERVDVRRVAPVRFGAAWVVGPLVVASAVATGLWVPVRQSGPVTPVSQREATGEQRAAAAEMIASAAAEARDTISGPVGARASTEELERMEQIERELLDGNRSPAEALAESSQQLESIADRVEREAAAEALADQATREAMADAIDAADDDSALAKALADGDLEAARDAASELFDRLDQLSPEERQRLAAELDRLAEQSARAPRDTAQIDSDASEPSSPASDPRLDELLREQGLEDMADIARSQDANAIRERLEQEGLEPEAARRLAEQIARENQERAAQESANEARDELADAAREAAEELREPPKPKPQDGNPQSNDPENTTPPEQGQQEREDEAKREQTDSGERPGGESSEQGEQGDGQPRTGEDGKSGEAQKGRESDQSQEGSDGQNQSQGDSTSQTEKQQDGQEQSKQQGERQGEGEQTGQQGEQQGNQQGNQQGDRQGEQQGPGEQPGQRPGGSEADPAGSEKGVQERPGGEGGEGDPQAAEGEPGEQGPERTTDGQGEAPDPRGVERLRKQLERMAERGESAQEKQRSAEKLREQAERMLDGASPEQREQLEELAREMARQNQRDGDGEPGGGAGTGPRRAEGAQPTPSGNWETEDVDARGEVSGAPENDGRVIAEWFGKDGEQAAGAGSAGSGTGAGSVVDEAAKGAERAVERRAVPRERRELIRRVFERYRQRAAERESNERSDGSGGNS